MSAIAEILLLILLVGHSNLGVTLSVPTPISSPAPQVLGKQMFIDSVNSPMVTLVNNERSKVGSVKLVEVSYIDVGASKRARDVFNGQWSHSGYEVAMRATIKYSGKVLAGETLARECFDNQQTMERWINSPTHKAVILDPRYKFVGFGSYQGICVLWFSNYK